MAKWRRLRPLQPATQEALSQDRVGVPRSFVLWSIAAFILSIDLLSKAYTHKNIPLMQNATPLYPYGGIPVWEDWHGIDFSINYVTNRGAAWGLGASFSQLLLCLRIGIVGALFFYLVYRNPPPRRGIPLVCILTGALGNILDHFLYGHVVDMFYFRLWGYSYPVFNVADSAIFCGVIGLFLEAFLSGSWSSKSSLGKEGHK